MHLQIGDRMVLSEMDDLEGGYKWESLHFSLLCSEWRKMGAICA